MMNRKECVMDIRVCDNGNLAKFDAYLDMVKTEVLADEIDNGNYAYDEIVKVEGVQGTITLEKA